MINASTNWKAKPFLLKPAGKDYLWGGNRLQTEFNKELPLEPLAETWECSTHPAGPSIIASGIYEGMSLTQLLAEHPEFSMDPFALPDPVGATAGDATLWPQRHRTDGFYICRMRRQA